MTGRTRAVGLEGGGGLPVAHCRVLMSCGAGDATAPHPRRQTSGEVLKAVLRHLKELKRLLALEPSGQPLISNTPSAQAGTSAHVPRQAKGEKPGICRFWEALRSV